MDDHPTNKILDGLRPKGPAVPLCPTCGSRLLPSGVCSCLGCPEYEQGAAAVRELDVMLLKDLYNAAERVAQRLEGTAASIRRRSVRSALNHERYGLYDATGYVGDILHELQAMQGNLNLDRLLRAARDFEVAVRDLTGAVDAERKEDA